MLKLSIMPLMREHVEEICEDIIDQQRRGISNVAMFMMKFNPDGTPPVNRAEKQCRLYDEYRSRLDRAGAKHGVLVQATLGHITKPSSPYPFSPTVSLVTGEAHVVSACPLDPGFRAYIKEQMRILAEHSPSMIMIDDDVGLLYKHIKGCACELHMAEFNRRAGTSMTREELYRHTQGKSSENKKYTSIYVETVRDSLIGAVKAMREGIDEVDPTIQGIVSGIYTSTYCEFSGEIAEAFAGQGNPKIMRLNGGPYANMAKGGRHFTENLYRAALLKENVKGKVDICLAETDTCPQNRYSTSAAYMHVHFVASILEGAKGAKHWITRLSAYEPIAGKAYRKILAENNGLYNTLADLSDRFTPFGCRIPLTTYQNYGFVPAEQGLFGSPWSTCVLERMGIPVYFGNGGNSAVFVDERIVNGFDDETVLEWLRGTVILSAPAAKKLADRGFSEYLGVSIREWEGESVTCELIKGTRIPAQYSRQELLPIRSGVESLSEVVRIDQLTEEKTVLFPGVTLYANSLGGKAVVFSGTPDMPLKYFTAFSMLNHTRKNQLLDITREFLPIYYPEDGEIYMRAGYLESGEMMVALFNLGFDKLCEIPLVIDGNVSGVEMLTSDGKRKECDFSYSDGSLTVLEELDPISPKILFIDVNRNTATK